MARIPINSGSDSGSDSTDTTAGDDDSQQNRREAVEEDPSSALSGIGLTDDTSSNTDSGRSNRQQAVNEDPGIDVTQPSSTGTSSNTDTGRSNRQQAINEGPGSDVSQPTSGGSNDTTPDDSTSNREAAANADQQLSQGIDNTEEQQTTGSDPTGARREAVEQEPDVPVRPSGPDIDPGDARQEAVAAEQQRTGQQTQPDPQPTNDRPSTGGEELEEIRRQAAASQDNLGPSDIRITENGDGEFGIQLSDEGVRQQATGDIPTLDADDVRVTDDGSVELTRQARQQRLRSQAALNLGVSQREINVFGDADGQLRPQLTDEGFATAAGRQAASQSDGLSAEDFQLTTQNGERQVTLTDAALREQAAADTDAVQAGDLRVTGEGADRSVELTGQARERLEAAREDEQFGDFEINVPGLNRSLEEIAGDTAEGIQQTFGGVADGLAAQATSDGAGVTQSLNPDGAFVSYGAGGIRGVGDLASLPFSAFAAGKEGVELVGYGANEALQGRGGEFADELTAASQNAAISAYQAAEANPFETGGRLVSGAALSGGAIAGATRVGGTTAGRATSAVIQPGEELVRAAARSGRIPTNVATKVPGVRESNIGAIDEFSDSSSVSSQVRAPYTDALPDARVRVDPDAGPLNVDPDVVDSLREQTTGRATNAAQTARQAVEDASIDDIATTGTGVRERIRNLPGAARRELIAARFEAASRVDNAADTVNNVRNLTLEIGDTERPSIYGLDAPDEPSIRSQLDDPLNIAGDGDTVDATPGAVASSSDSGNILPSTRLRVDPDAGPVRIDPELVSTIRERVSSPSPEIDGPENPFSVDGISSPFADTDSVSGFIRDLPGRTRQELAAARFGAAERIDTGLDALSDLPDTTVEIGNPERPSIYGLDAPDEPSIRSQLDDPLNIAEDAETVDATPGSAPSATEAGNVDLSSIRIRTDPESGFVRVNSDIPAAVRDRATSQLDGVSSRLAVPSLSDRTAMDGIDTSVGDIPSAFRRELAAARFGTAERLRGARSTLADIPDLTLEIGNPNRASIYDLDAPDEPPIRSQTDNPFDLDGDTSVDGDSNSLPGGGSSGTDSATPGSFDAGSQRGSGQIQRLRMRSGDGNQTPVRSQGGRELDNTGQLPIELISETGADAQEISPSIDGLQYQQSGLSTSMSDGSLRDAFSVEALGTELGVGAGTGTDTTIGPDTGTDTGTDSVVGPDIDTGPRFDTDTDIIGDTSTDTRITQNTRIGGRPAEGQQEVEGVFPQRDEDEFSLDWPLDQESDLEDTGILSAEDVRQQF